MHWSTKLNLTACSYLINSSEATHMVFGCEKKGWPFQLIAFASNEFTAHRIKRAVIECGGTATVKEYSKENYSKLEDAIVEEFFNRVNKR